jgi:hypothetical protein
MRVAFTVAVSAVLAAGLAITAPALAAPAQLAKPGPPKSYLYVVDGSDVHVKPGKGRQATIIITKPSAVAFTDRPYRHQSPMTVPALLREFGWTPATGRLAGDTPNAAVSVAGSPSQIVDIVSARIADRRLVLKVMGVGAPLTARKGPGSLFIDNVFVFSYPWTQAVALDSSGYWTAVVTLTDTTTGTVVLKAGGLSVGSTYISIPAASPPSNSTTSWIDWEDVVTGEQRFNIRVSSGLDWQGNPYVWVQLWGDDGSGNPDALDGVAAFESPDA